MSVSIAYVHASALRRDETHHSLHRMTVSAGPPPNSFAASNVEPVTSMTEEKIRISGNNLFELRTSLVPVPMYTKRCPICRTETEDNFCPSEPGAPRDLSLDQLISRGPTVPEVQGAGIPPDIHPNPAEEFFDTMFAIEPDYAVAPDDWLKLLSNRPVLQAH